MNDPEKTQPHQTLDEKQLEGVMGAGLLSCFSCFKPKTQSQPQTQAPRSQTAPAGENDLYPPHEIFSPHFGLAHSAAPATPSTPPKKGVTFTPEGTWKVHKIPVTAAERNLRGKRS